MKSRLAFLLAISVAVPAAFALAQESATTNMDILRQKIKADKKLLVAESMGLTDAEGKAFWPIYDAYQKDLQRLNGRIKTTIEAYAEAYNKGSLSNETAKKLLNEAIAIDEAEAALKRSYLPKLEKVLPMAKVARYIQIENKIRALLRYELAAEIPLVD
jgi:hypothetical protein